MATLADGQANQPADDKYIVWPVYKALRLLRAIAEADGGVSVTEAGRLAGLPKSTVFKYLRTLESAGFLVHDRESDSYRMGLAVWQLGQLADHTEQLRLASLPLLKDLVDRFEETANVGVLDGAEVVYLESVESPHALRMQAHTGSRDPAHCTALGKAILAYLPHETWRRKLPSQLIAATPNTITSIGDLDADLEATRRRGFAIDNEENEAGATCIAVPIRDNTGYPIGALSLSAPSWRFDGGVQRRAAQMLAEAASTCAQRLGYVVPRDDGFPAAPRW